MPHICEYIDKNAVLEAFDITCNEFGDEAGRLLLEALDGNTVLRAMDMRLTKFDHESELQISDVLQLNTKRASRATGIDR